MSEQDRTPEEAEQELVNAWVAWKEDTEIGVADPSVARALIRQAAAPELQPIKSTPGAFFEVTGTESELFRIVEGINRNDGRLTSDSSMTLDLWQEMLEEWHARRDAKVRAEERAARPEREQFEARAWTHLGGPPVVAYMAGVDAVLSSLALEPGARVEGEHA